MSTPLRTVPAGFEVSKYLIRDLAKLTGVPLGLDGLPILQDADQKLRSLTLRRAVEIHGSALEALHSVGSLLFWAQARDEPLRWAEIGDGVAYAVQLLADLAMVADDVRGAVEIAEGCYPVGEGGDRS